VAQVRDFFQSKGQLTTTKGDAKINASNYIREKGWPQFKFIENERQLEYGSSICKSVLKYHKIKDYIQVPPGETLNAVDVKKNLKVHHIRLEYWDKMKMEIHKSCNHTRNNRNNEMKNCFNRTF
jgi:hypothetical protein